MNKKLSLLSTLCALVLTSCSLFTSEQDKTAAPEIAPVVVEEVVVNQETLPENAACSSTLPEASDNNRAISTLQGGAVTEFKAGMSLQNIVQHNAVVVDFYGTQCGPCKQMSPIVDAVAPEFPNVAFIKVNVETFQPEARAYGAQSIPTFLLFSNGVKVAQKTGSMNKAAFRALIKTAFNSK